MIVLKKAKRKITTIILHCTATQENKDFSVDDIRKWHTAPKPKGQGWSDIGYHYIIYRDGTIHTGRDVNIIGAHTLGYNADSIGICYIGGIDINGKAKDTRTPEQKIAIIKLVKELLALYNLNINNVFCHNQLANKSCPSFKIETFKKEYNEEK